MRFYDRIENGEFANKIGFPAKPIKPWALNKKPSDLTDYELANIISIKQDFEVEIEAWQVAFDVYHIGEDAANEKFKQAALIELGLAEHPKADMLYDKAWEYGHTSWEHGDSSIYSEVWTWMKELSPFLN